MNITEERLQEVEKLVATNPIDAIDVTLSMLLAQNKIGKNDLKELVRRLNIAIRMLSEPIKELN